MEAQTALLDKEEVQFLFDDIVKNYGSRLRRLISVMVYNPSEIDDIYQDGMINLYSALPKFRKECSPSSYATSCFLNTIRNYIKSKRWEFLGEDKITLADEKTPEVLFLKRENSLEQKLYSALDTLEKESPEQAEIYKLMIDFFQKYDKNLSDKEIADTLDIPLNTVKTRKFRARQRLRELIDENEWYW